MCNSKVEIHRFVVWLFLGLFFLEMLVIKRTIMFMTMFQDFVRASMNHVSLNSIHIKT